MRILRGKSNLEVSSQGFAWFVVGLVFATFIGGAVRTILSSDRVHKRIVTELRSRFPQQEFQVGQTEVLLSRGMWPGLGLRVKNLSFRQEVCGKLSFLVEVPQAVLPVDLFALRKGSLRLGRVEMSNGSIHLNYKPCPPDPITLDASRENLEPKKPVISAPSLDWNKVSRHLDGIEMSNFAITYERNRTWKLLVHSMRFNVSDDLSVQGLMELQKSLPFGSLSHVINLDAQGDDRVLQWGVHSVFKEGNVQLKGSIDLNNHAASAQAFVRQLPMKDVMSELHQMGFSERDVRLKASWLSCALKWEGSADRANATPVVANDCKVEGAYGRVELDTAEFWLDHPNELKKEAVVKISKLQMQHVLEALGRQVLPKVLARPGFWSGDLHYLTPDSWKLEGNLESAEIIFSNRSVRGKQVLDKMRTTVARVDSKIEAKIDQLEIRGGEFAGDLKFTLQNDWRNGEFKADIQKLRFSPAIQTLLVGGTLGNLKFTGEGALTAGELSRWDGDSEVEQITGSGWSVAGLKIKSRYSPGVFHLEGRALEASLNPPWKGYAQLQAVRPETDDTVMWRDVQAKGDIQASGGVIQSVTGVDFESKQPWRLKGSWVRDGEFNAVLAIGAAKPKNFALTGEKGVLNVQERLR